MPVPGETPETKLGLKEARPTLGDAVAKLEPRLESPAPECVFKYGVGTGPEVEVVDGRYCNGKAGVGVELCNEARSDHTPPIGGCGNWDGGGIG